MMASLSRQLAQWVVGLRYKDLPPEVLDLMKRVTLIPSHQMTLFGPRITIYTKDGQHHTKQATGREFMWDFNEEARRIRDVIPGLTIPGAQFEAIIATCGDLHPARSGRYAHSADAEAGVSPARPRGSQVGEALSALAPNSTDAAQGVRERRLT
jgi:hypothetical protein